MKKIVTAVVICVGLLKVCSICFFMIEGGISEGLLTIAFFMVLIAGLFMKYLIPIVLVLIIISIVAIYMIKKRKKIRALNL